MNAEGKTAIHHQRDRVGPRQLIFRVVGVMLGLVVACLALELFFQILGEPPPVRRLERADVPSWPTYLCFPSNPNGEFQPLPDTSRGTWFLGTISATPEMVPWDKLAETPWCVESRLSQLGLRDRDYSSLPRENVARILCVGDSFAYGYGVPVERALCRRMETLLGPGYEIVNAGAPGADTEQELQTLAKLVPLLHANRAIMVFIANDIGQTPELQAREQRIPELLSAGMDRWYAISALARFVMSRINMRRASQATIDLYKDRYDPAHNKENLELLAAQFRALAKRRDCQTVLVLYPLMEELEGEYPLADVHARVAAMAQLAGLPVLDLAPAFQGQQTTSLWVHDSDHHPNGKAQAIAAKALVEWLRSLPGFLNGSP